MASISMARVSSSASDSDESNCITVLPLQEDNESLTTLTDRIPKQRSERKQQAAKPKRSTSTRRTSRFVEGDMHAPEKRTGTANGTRNISGQTLVDNRERSNQDIVQKSIDKLDLDWKVDMLPGDTLRKLATKQLNKKGRTARLNVVAKAAAKAVTSVASVLGKRGRDTLESGKEKVEKIKSTHRASLRPRLNSTPSNEGLEPATKKTKTENSAKYRDPAPWELNDRKKQRKIVNRYVTQGLYAGQDRYFDPRFNEKKNKRRSASKVATTPVPENKTLPLPMFAGERLLENGRDFKLPFSVCNPLMTGPPKADEWKKVKKNRFVGAAADHWRKHKPLAPSLCMCTPEEGCGENCHNVMMYYECDETNCNVGPEHCRNRNFADLKDRVRKGGKFNIGVDAMMTADRGWGVRANRTFRPNQIIMEYAGEIITQEECENRMRNEYKDNKCYYLMEFEQGMIIDATRGSMARFVNHSCEPNCRMEQWKVNGEPRMALFAGDDGILVGEELTYDYNFDPFSSQNVQECRCGAPSCRGVLGPRTRDAPKPKKETPGSGSSSSSSGTKRKLSSMLKRTDSLADEADRPIKKAKTLKEAAQKAYSITKSRLANALHDAELSRTQAHTQKKAKSDKENDARAARLVRRRTGPTALSATPSTEPSFSSSSPSAPEKGSVLVSTTAAIPAPMAPRRRRTLAATKTVHVSRSVKRAVNRRATVAGRKLTTLAGHGSPRKKAAVVEQTAAVDEEEMAPVVRESEEDGEGGGKGEAVDLGFQLALSGEEEEKTASLDPDQGEQAEVGGLESFAKEIVGSASEIENAFDWLIAGSRRARADEMQRAEMRKKRAVKKTLRAIESEARMY